MYRHLEVQINFYVSGRFLLEKIGKKMQGKGFEHLDTLSKVEPFVQKHELKPC